jgi:hypothetical protein
MERDELSKLVELIQNDAQAILEHQAVLAGVKEQIAQNRRSPFEQDSIYADHYGDLPSQPQERTIDGIRITTQILHQTGIGLRDIAGADLLYEIEGEKYALIQYKRPNRQNLVQNDQAQLDALLSKCPSVCSYKGRANLLQPPRLNGYCGCWYNCLTNDGSRYVHACEAKAIFTGKASVSERKFASGMTKEEFDRLFAVCRIGALVRIQSSAHYVQRQLSSNHLVFYLFQHRR